MSRPRSHFRRPDLMYRALLRDESDAPNDALFDLLTRKVVEHLSNKSIDEWEKEQWAAYRMMLAQHTKAPILHGKSEEEAIGEMSLADLRKLTSSDEV